MDNHKIITSYRHFLKKILENITNTGINLYGYQLDHIAYRAETLNKYKEVMGELFNMGEMISEIRRGNQKISIYRLIHPIHYDRYDIPYFELLGPKENGTYKEGYQHIEFVIDIPLLDFIKMYPAISFDTSHINREINPSIELRFEDNMGVEFHLIDIGKTVELQSK